jgi:hypothetical protein
MNEKKKNAINDLIDVSAAKLLNIKQKVFLNITTQFFYL